MEETNLAGESTGQNSRGKILIIDDDQQSRSAYTKLLMNHGYQIRSDSMGSNTLRHIKKESPDILMIDINISDIDLESILRALQKENIALPVIVLCNETTKQEIKMLVNLGIKFILQKSSPDDVILNKVQEVFSVTEKEGDATLAPNSEQ